MCFPNYLSKRLSIYLPIRLSTFLPISLSIYLSLRLSISLFLSFYVSAYLSFCASVYLPVWASLPIFLCVDLHLAVQPPYLILLEEVTPLAGCGAGTLPWGQRTACSNKAGGV